MSRHALLSPFRHVNNNICKLSSGCYSVSCLVTILHVYLCVEMCLSKCIWVSITLHQHSTIMRRKISSRNAMTRVISERYSAKTDSMLYILNNPTRPDLWVIWVGLLGVGLAQRLSMCCWLSGKLYFVSAKGAMTCAKNVSKKNPFGVSNTLWCTICIVKVSLLIRRWRWFRLVLVDLWWLVFVVVVVIAYKRLCALTHFYGIVFLKLKTCNFRHGSNEWTYD